jgi:competence protein ComEA
MPPKEPGFFASTAIEPGFFVQVQGKTAMEQGTVRHWGYAILGVVLALIVGGVIGYFAPHPPPDTPIIVSTPLPTHTPPPSPTPSPIRVHVAGAVHQPGVYRLPANSIIQDAVDVAGGPASDADLDRINLAIELRDQQQVYVPREGETSSPPPVSGGEGSEGTDTLVNINTATQAELETLPRIGPELAQRILDYREANGPFETIEDIQNVPGIGPGTFEGLKDMIVVGP